MPLSSPSQSLELAPEQRVDFDLDFAPSKPLESLELGDIGLCPLPNQAEPDLHDESGAQTPSDADQLVSHQLQSWSSPPTNRWRVLSCCLVYFGNGLNDSAPGALIPSMEAHYRIGYAVVSLIFVSQAVGFVSAAFFTDAIKTRLGQARTYALSELLMVASYAVIVASPPYPLVVVVFFFLGWAMAMNLAMSNVFCANLAQSTVILGAAHGAYGVGGTIGPIMATAMVSRGIGWSRYYSITLAICLAGALASGWSFRGIENEPQTSPERTSQQAVPTSKRSLLMEALKNPVTIIGALFTFAYQGAEVSISGWVISFLITVRQGDPSKVGYVTAGFWAGITLGRFTLSHLAARLGERRAVFALGLAAAAFQLLVWLVPSIAGDAVAVALVGYALGPVAPCSMTLFTRALPRSIQTSAVGFVSSAGASGGAAWPFVTGLVAQERGTYVLHPICIALFAFMLGCWWMLAVPAKRAE